MQPLLEQLHLLGVVPVVVLENAADAEPLARALCQGGLPCMEVTFRTKAAEESIRAIAASHPEILLGAGTVLSTEQVDRAVAAGARFIVSPGLNPGVVEHCLARQIPVLPGVATPSDVERALGLGLDAVKFFPAEAAGGAAYLKAMSAPYKMMRFVPTGGVSAANLLGYLKMPAVLACGGSWMVAPELLAARRFDEVTRLAREAVTVALGFELRHVGINCPDPAAAQEASGQLAALLGGALALKEGASSIFVGSSFEFTKKPFLGQHGHLALGTQSVPRAVAFLGRAGYTVRPETRSEKNGKVVSVYLEQEIAGFALHLLQL